MAAVHRQLEKHLQRWMGKNKVLLVFGTRRVGKTVLLHKLAEKQAEHAMVLNGEDFDVQALLARRAASHYRQIVGDKKLIIIDEAQAVPDIGPILKLLIDSLPHITVIASGSSAFDLGNKTGEPLTGRSIRFQLHPFNTHELRQHFGYAHEKINLRERLVFGQYPEVVTAGDYADKEMYLNNLIQSYLLKDILLYEGIKNSNKLAALLRLIAYQIGSEVSYQELGNQLGLSRITVENYLDLLSKVFVLFKLPAYSTNPRKEISKGAKWYFYDNGVRNALIGDYRDLSLRNDSGPLWENYVVSEFMKKQDLASHGANTLFFWRNYNQQEVDLLQVKNSEIQAFEMKFNANKKVRFPAGFRNTYPQASLQQLDPDSFFDIINELNDTP